MLLPTARFFTATAVTLATALVVPPVATAQLAGGSTRVGALVGASFGASDSARALAVSARHTFVPRLAVEGELAHFADLTLVELTPLNGSWHARATSVTANVVFALTGDTSRLRPFVSVGGGAARVRRSTRDTTPDRTDVKPVVSAGGGVDVPIWNRLAVGVDVRYQRVFEDQALFRPNLRNLARVGSSLSYRF